MMSKLIHKSLDLTYMTIFYQNAKINSAMDYIIFRELYLHGAKIIIGALAYILLLTFGTHKWILAGFLTLGIINAIWLGKLKEEI